MSDPPAPKKRGGRRPGAGRKPRPGTVARAEVKARADDFLNGNLQRRLETLGQIAEGGYECEVEERWEPAGLILIDHVLMARDDDGKEHPVFDEKGRPIKVKVSAFQHLPPDQLVLVGRKRKIAGPDRAANEFLVEQALGRAKQRVEMGGDFGASILVKFEADIARVYGAAAIAVTSGPPALDPPTDEPEPE